MLPFIVLLRHAEAKPPKPAIPVTIDKMTESHLDSRDEEPVLVEV
jgi:hypothetical protein